MVSQYNVNLLLLHCYIRTIYGHYNFRDFCFLYTVIPYVFFMLIQMIFSICKYLCKLTVAADGNFVNKK